MKRIWIAVVVASAQFLQVVYSGQAMALATASVANLALPNLAYSHTAGTNTGTMTLTADDTGGLGAGWNVTITASPFLYTGSATGTPIPAANFSLTSTPAPVRVSGQAIDATGGPKVPAASPLGTLDAARKTLQAAVGFGAGKYTQALGVSLVIPSQSRAGTYTSTLTTTILAGP